MANKFCDTTLATGANDGSSTDDAWQNIETALEGTIGAAGDKLWIRRVSSFSSPTSDIAVVDDGTIANPLYIIGAPRDAETGTGTVTNGSNVVSAVATISPDFEKHVTRRFKNDTDGQWYMITAIAHKIDYDNESGTFTEGLLVTGGTSGAVGKIHRLVDAGTTGTLWVVVQSGTFQNNEQITDADTGVADINGTPSDDGFIIERKYAGSTAATAACTIEADEDYTEFSAIDDSAWTIKISTWEADADDLPVIDFGSANYALYIQGALYMIWKNIHMKGSIDPQGSLFVRSTAINEFRHFIVEQSNNAPCSAPYHDASLAIFDHCVFKGNYTGASQRGFRCVNGHATWARHMAIYNMGDWGISARGGSFVLEHVNIGIELPNLDYDIDVFGYLGSIRGRDVAVGGLNGGIQLGPTDIAHDSTFPIQNYQKVLNQHQTNIVNTELFQKVDVVAGAGDPEKRSGGADSVLEVPGGYNALYIPTEDSWKLKLFEHYFWADTSSKSYRYYVQCKDMAVTDAGELFIEVEYVEDYDDDNEYYLTKTQSDETMTLRSGASDWSQYMEVTGIQPGVASLLTIRCFAALPLDTDGYVYIDPQVVIS